MTVVDLYTIQIIYDAGIKGLYPEGHVAAMIAETEENLTDMLPLGYRARISRWNDPDERTPSE